MSMRKFLVIGFAALFVHCGGVETGGTTGGSTTGGSANGSTSGGTTGGSSTTTTTTSGSTTTGGSTTGSASCVDPSTTFLSDLPISNGSSFLDQDCTAQTASQCSRGNCLEWNDATGAHGKCWVYCDELNVKPAVGEACTAFSTCRLLKGGNICVPNLLNLCAASTSGSTGGTTGGSTTGGTTGSTTSGSCKEHEEPCSDDADCCSTLCRSDGTCSP